MKTIKELLEKKGPTPTHSVTPEDTVFTSVTRMVENNVGSMLVLENNVIRGIITERDYLRFITKKGRTARDTPVTEAMTKTVIYGTPEMDLGDVMAIFTEHRIRHLPVMHEGRLMGIISIGDVVKQIGKNQEVQIKTLEAYISDPYPGPAGGEARA